MSGIYQWVRNIACYLCIFNVVLHVIPGNGYKKYIRFVGGILLVILVITPIADAMNVSGSFESAFRIEGLKEELDEMKTAKEGLADLQVEKVDEAFKLEVKNQLERIVKSYDYYPVKTEVEFEKTDGNISGIEMISMVISKKNKSIDIHVDQIQNEDEKEPAEVEIIKKEIEDVYQIPGEHIDMDVRE